MNNEDIYQLLANRLQLPAALDDDYTLDCRQSQTTEEQSPGSVYDWDTKKEDAPWTMGWRIPPALPASHRMHLPSKTVYPKPPAKSTRQRGQSWEPQKM